MKKTTSRLSSLLLVMTVALGSLFLTTSCSDDGLLKSIPADVDMAASINFTRLSDELGIEIGESTISGPADMKVEFQSIPSETRNLICGLNGAIDASCVMAFGNFSVNAPEESFYLLARVTDSDKLDQLLSEETDLKKQTIDGFDVYPDNNTFILTTDDCLWILPQQPSAEAAVRNIKSVRERAKKESIAKLDHVAKRLSNEKVINMVMNLDPMVDFISNNAYAFLDTQQAMMAAAILPMIKGNWLDLNFDLDDNTFALQASAFSPKTGDTALPPDGFDMSGIDDDLLEYLPANTMMAYAAGLTGKTVQQLCSGLAVFTAGNPVLAPFMKTLSKLDGTIAIGFGSDAPGSFLTNFNTKGATMFAAMQFTDGGAEEFKSQIVSLLSATGSAKATEAGAMTRIEMGSNSFNLITQGNNLFLTTSPTLEAKSNTFAKDMDGYHAAFELLIPNMGELTSDRCHMQLKAMFTYKEGVSTFSVSFDKLQGSLLSELYKAVQGLNQSVKSKYPQMSEPVPADNDDLLYPVPADSMAVDELLEMIDKD